MASPSTGTNSTIRTSLTSRAERPQLVPGCTEQRSTPLRRTAGGTLTAAPEHYVRINRRTRTFDAAHPAESGVGGVPARGVPVGGVAVGGVPPRGVPARAVHTAATAASTPSVRSGR